MREIWFCDATMPLQPAAGEKLTFRKKLELAALLDRLGVRVIETEPIRDKKADSLLVKSLASAVSSAVLSVPAALLEEGSAEEAFRTLSDAAHPRLSVPVPLSTVQMEYICHKKPAAVLAAMENRIAECRSLTEDVELVALDAGRSDPAFLKDALLKACTAGAGTVTLCDDAGTMLPEELGAFTAAVREYLPAEVRLGVRVADTLHLSAACSLAAARAGADEIKVLSAGAGTAGLEELSDMLRLRGADFGLCTSLNYTEVQRTCERVRTLLFTGRSKTTPFEDGVRSNAGEVALTIHDDITSVSRAARRLGYDLNEEDVARVYEAFTRIASRKNSISSKELDAIVASAALQVPPVYRLESFVINSGNVISATAHVRLKKHGELLEGIAVGDGPIDAAFLAIEQIVGCHYELDDFQIQAVTEGREAMGETVVRLLSRGKVYSGRGISTDIIGSGIHAYINALNKIVYEEAGA